MALTRRDFLRASSALAAALGLRQWGTDGAFAAEGGPSVVWLQASGCNGDSVSLLNSIEHGTIDGLLLNTLDVNYHPTLMAAAGSAAVAAAREAYNKKGYILVVEGAVPTGASGRYCTVWDGMTAVTAARGFARNAAFILAVGTCASYGGVSAGRPNPTSARGLKTALPGRKIINIPGCPAHPAWIVGTVAYLLRYKKAPKLDKQGRPTALYGRSVHDRCPYLDEFDRYYRRRYSHSKKRACFECHDGRREEADDIRGPNELGEVGCLYAMGCKGVVTGCDCPERKWNSGAAGVPGVNWCVAAGSPCIGCTEPGFPDQMSPFFALLAPGAAEDEDDDEHDDDDDDRHERDDDDDDDDDKEEERNRKKLAKEQKKRAEEERKRLEKLRKEKDDD